MCIFPLSKYYIDFCYCPLPRLEKLQKVFSDFYSCLAKHFTLFCIQPSTFLKLSISWNFTNQIWFVLTGTRISKLSWIPVWKIRFRFYPSYSYREYRNWRIVYSLWRQIINLKNSIICKTAPVLFDSMKACHTPRQDAGWLG